ncbi:HlyD family type I secretion periplasmic adaptor subunit [Sphingomonas sp. M1-B02]|uniref:HlyD family type I secretion periplasmic adaptor subunit n=1 Tax=Sphingomonas sp. M1-B02 TaxID=3114300 RepID=UPI00223FB16B|nr:HlyD family type I secretion periplasmic adaptor subunit [Sphingomonas sp. S6-11]UZK67716.1 HlyD family type I secretion periplasmic adaptor subunit [Sphingomonas sp. S6-11]
MPSQEKRGRRSWTIRKPLGIGLAALIGLFGFVFVWASTFNISGAVIGKGQVQASVNRIAVQHPIGGVVAKILVNSGDKVKSGDVVVKLDDSSLRSELATIDSELFELLANEARLEAELENRATLAPHPLLQEARQNNPGVESLLKQQQRQLDAHFRSVGTQVSLLHRQRSQISDEAIGVQSALTAKREELALLEDELSQAKQNLQNGYVTRTVVSNLQRDTIKARGELGSLAAKKAELNGKVAEQSVKTYAAPLDIREVSADRLNLLRQQSKRLIENRNALVYKLSKLDVRAPVGGRVFDSKLLGPLSVVEAAKPIMYIVPNDKPGLVVVRVDATDIEQVQVGQETGLRFTTFNKRSTPIIDGRVTAISADAFRDEKTQAFYYFVDVSLLESEMQKLGNVELLPGMPVDAFLKTESRSPASYVIRPITDFFAKAFRD